jgi:hypothetical protein
MRSLHVISLDKEDKLRKIHACALRKRSVVGSSPAHLPGAMGSLHVISLDKEDKLGKTHACALRK